MISGLEPLDSSGLLFSTSTKSATFKYRHLIALTCRHPPTVDANQLTARNIRFLQRRLHPVPLLRKLRFALTLYLSRYHASGPEDACSCDCDPCYVFRNYQAILPSLVLCFSPSIISSSRISKPPANLSLFCRSLSSLSSFYLQLSFQFLLLFLLLFLTLSFASIFCRNFPRHPTGCSSCAVLAQDSDASTFVLVHALFHLISYSASFFASLI